MTVIKSRPTSPGRRFRTSVRTPDLHRGGPYRPLTEGQSKTGGRNNQGRITQRHVGVGHKQRYRRID